MDSSEPRPVGAFHSYTLRTTSVDDAARFYSDVLGEALPSGSGPLRIVPLPDRARARGAPSHWLGQIGVATPADVTSRFLSLGATLLGPATHPVGDGPHTLKDPGGAIVSVGTPDTSGGPSGVGWHLANVTELEPVWRCYAETFGWCAIEDGDLPGGLGGFRVFGWEEGGPAVGMVAETARGAHVHTHWQFHLDVPDLNAALELVRMHGGKVASGPIEVFGARFAACDDPQGAAVAFREVLP